VPPAASWVLACHTSERRNLPSDLGFFVLTDVGYCWLSTGICGLLADSLRTGTSTVDSVYQRECWRLGSYRSRTPLSVETVRHWLTLGSAHRMGGGGRDLHRYTLASIPGSAGHRRRLDSRGAGRPADASHRSYPRSRMGASAFVGWSPSAGRVLLVLAYQDLDGNLHGLNAWPASGRDLFTYNEWTGHVEDDG